jgi:hypothetical protein
VIAAATLKSPVQAAEERMLKGLRGLCEKAKPLPRTLTALSRNRASRANRRATWIRSKSLSASSAKLMTIDARAAMLALPPVTPMTGESSGKTCRCFPYASQSYFWEAPNSQMLSKSLK